ncbi:hypothetical protein [Micromonospora sediminicola]
MPRSDDYQRQADDLQKRADNTPDPVQAQTTAIAASIARALARRTRKRGQ